MVGSLDNFIGVLSVIRKRDFDNPNPFHEIIRYVQTRSINDAKRILGNYDASEIVP